MIVKALENAWQLKRPVTSHFVEENPYGRMVLITVAPWSTPERLIDFFPNASYFEFLKQYRASFRELPKWYHRHFVHWTILYGVNEQADSNLRVSLFYIASCHSYSMKKAEAVGLASNLPSSLTNFYAITPKDLLTVEPHTFLEQIIDDDTPHFLAEQNMDDPVLAIKNNDKGFKHYMNGEYEKALNEYNKAIEIWPNLAVAYDNRGCLYAAIKRYDEAIADFNQEARIEPNKYSAYYNRGLVCTNLQKFSKAISDFTTCVHLDPRKYSGYYNRGCAYYQMGELDKAKSDFTKAIEIDPKSSEAYNNRGTVYQDLGQNKKAIHDFKYAITHDKKNLNAYLNLGALLANNGDDIGAYPHYITAARLGSAYAAECVQMIAQRNDL